MNVTDSGWSTLIIRVWRTEDSQLRARLTELDNVEGPERAVAVAGLVDDVLDATRAWLTRVLPASDDCLTSGISGGLRCPGTTYLRGRESLRRLNCRLCRISATSMVIP